MKLFVLTNALEKGGAEKLLVSCLPLFKKKGLDVQLVLLNAKKSVPAFLTEIKDAGIPVHDIAAENFYNPFNAFKLFKFFKKHNADVLHVHLFPSLYWASIAMKLSSSRPYLLYTEHSNQNKRRGKPYFRLIEKNIYPTYDQIIGITDSVRDNLVEWIGCQEKIVTILNGVDLQKITQAPLTDLAEIGIPPGAKTIFMAASFRYPKDQTTILKAVASLGDRYHAIFAGEGPLLDDVKKEAVKLSVAHRTHFLGFRNDVASLMKSVDLNILSSHYEGMSGVTLESLASGVPFLGSDVPGINEIVPDSRFLFEAGNANDLAAKINVIMNDNSLRTNMKNTAESFVSQYDMNFMADRYIELYRKFAGRKPAR